MTPSPNPHGHIARTFIYAQKVKAMMKEKGLNSRDMTCPWCNTKGALQVLYNAHFNPDFIITCTATPDCMDYKERKTAR